MYTKIYLGYTILLGLSVVLFYWRYSSQRNIEKLLFWLFGSVLIIFTGARRFGAGMDDGVHYTQHYWPLCPIAECFNALEQGRDSLWYGVMAILKSLWPTPSVMLWLAAAGLSVKLLIIENLSRFRLLALLVFVSIFYQTHDMTTFRQSFAELFFFVGFWLMVRVSFVKAAPVLLMSGLSHQQAYLTPLIMLGGRWIHRWQHLLLLVFCLFVLIVFGLTPEPLLHAIKEYRGWFPVPIAKIVASAADSFYAKPIDGYSIYALPIVVYPLTVWVLYTLNSAWGKSKNRLASCVSYSVAFAYIMLWIFAGSEIWQYRLFYFYLLPIIFVVGGVELRSPLFWMTILVAGIYVVKYNVLHEMFAQPSRVKVTSAGLGHINIYGYWVPCGLGCAEVTLGSNVQLIPKAAPGYRFLEWAGDCVGSSVPCALKVELDRNIAAIFTPAFSLSALTVGEGLVSTMPLGVDSTFVYVNANGANCAAGCQTTIDAGLTITISATPELGYRFTHWEGACAGVEPVCSLQMNENYSVKAFFEPLEDRMDAGKAR
jgi:hypothetical protein